MLKPSGFTTGTTIVRVCWTSCVVRGVAPVVAQQVVGELDRVLRRRPLARVVHAHDQEDRLAVAGVLRAGRDLDAVHVAAEHAAVVQRDRPDERRILHRQVLHLEVVVGQPPVAGAAARKAGGWRSPARGARRGARCAEPAPRGRRPARGSGSPPRAACGRRRGRGAAPRPSSRRRARSGRGRAPGAGSGRRAWAWPRRPRSSGPLRFAMRVKRIETRALRRVAAEAAGLHHEPLTPAHEPRSELVPAEGGRAGDEAAVPAEHAEIPVPGRPEPNADEPARGRLRPEQPAARRGRRDVLEAGTRHGVPRRDGPGCGGRRCGKSQRTEQCACDERASLHATRPYVQLGRLRKGPRGFRQPRSPDPCR